jgi:hypothetical protein
MGTDGGLALHDEQTLLYLLYYSALQKGLLIPAERNISDSGRMDDPSAFREGSAPQTGCTRLAFPEGGRLPWTSHLAQTPICIPSRERTAVDEKGGYAMA